MDYTSFLNVVTIIMKQVLSLSLSPSLTHLHELERAIGDGVEMRRGFVASFVAVVIAHDLRVYVQPLVGVDADAEEAGIRVDLQDLVARTQIVQDASPVFVVVGRCSDKKRIM